MVRGFYIFNFLPYAHEFSNWNVTGVDAQYEPDNWAACLFLYPAYRWTCRQLDNRLLAARLHIQGDHAETVL